MQDNSFSTRLSSNLSASTLTQTSDKTQALSNLSLDGSSILAHRLATSMISQRAKIFSNIKSLDQEDQKALVLPFLNNLKSADYTLLKTHSIVSKNSKQLMHLFPALHGFNLKLQEDQTKREELEPQSNSKNEILTELQQGYPICFNPKSAYHLVNLSQNLKRTYEKGPSFGPLERAHMEWMENNEITTDRAAYIKSRKLSMYRNLVFQGSDAAMRHTLLDEFLFRRNLYPKKEAKGLNLESLNKTFEDVVNTCESWYKQGQNFAISMLKRHNQVEDGTKSLLSELEGKSITIDWDKAFHYALRSHSIAQVLGISPQILFLSGFAAIDIKQIVLCNDLKSVEKMMIVAQIVLKTLLKIIVVLGTQLFTSGMLGLGGVDVIDVPFGVHGERYLQKQLTDRVFRAIDTQFDSIKVRAEDIVDC